jgi:hypothetical protein
MSKIIEVEIEVGSKQALKSLQDLETAQEQLLQQLKQTEIGTAEYKRLQKQLKSVGNQVKDLELGFEALDKEQRATAIVDSFSGVAGAISAATGAFTLFGAESQQLEEVEKRILGLIALSSGLRDLSNGFVALQKLGPELADSFKGAGNAIKTAFTTATGSINATKVALTGLGIGAVILVISQLVEASSKLSKQSEELAAKLEEEAEFRLEISKNIETETKKVSALVAITESENTTKEQKKKAIEAIQKDYPDYLKNADLDKVTTQDIALANDELNKSLIKRAQAQAFANKIATLGAQILDKQLALEQRSENIRKSQQEAAALGLSQRETELFLAQRGFKINQNVLENEIKQLEVTQQGLVTKAQELGLVNNITTANDKNTKAIEKQTEAEKAAIKAKEELEKKRLQAADIAAEAEDEVAEILLSAREKEIEDVKDRYKEKLTLLTEIYGIESDEVKNLTILQNKEISDINFKYDQEEIAKTKEKEQKKADIIKEIGNAIAVTEEEKRQKEIDDTIAYYDKLIEEAKKYGLDITAIEEAKSKKLEEINNKDRETFAENAEEFANQVNDLANTAKDFVNTIGDFYKANSEAQVNFLKSQLDQGIITQEEYDKRFEELNKKTFEEQKKVSIASAIISTLQGALDAFTSTLKIDPTGITGSVLAAFALAAGFAQVDAIKSTNYGSTSTSAAAPKGGGGIPSTKTLTGRGTNTGPAVPIPLTPTTGGGTIGPEDDMQTVQTGGGGSVFKTYVLSGDVTSAQDADFRLRTQRKF